MTCDTMNRPATDLRISVTDRCNYRCTYCMPSGKYEWIDRREILTYEEITRLAAILVSLGVRKIRITGGEPLLRHDLTRLIAALANLDGVRDLSMTTNGSLLAESAAELAAAGLKRINVSLDTLRPEKFKCITQRDELSRVVEGLFRARECGLRPVKINMVVERGLNDDEIIPMLEFGCRNGFPVRFVEYMDVGNVNGWRLDKMVPKEEILKIIRNAHSLVEAGRSDSAAPSVDYRLEEGDGEVGIIASVTEPFCAGCTRLRLTADGRLVTCLFSGEGFDVKRLLRSHASEDSLRDFVMAIWTGRKDRYSEERLEALRSAGGYATEARRKIEMFRLGG